MKINLSDYLGEIIFCVILIVVLYVNITFNSFGARCEKAGYENAELELCVKRAKSGGPVHLENVDKWN